MSDIKMIRDRDGTEKYYDFNCKNQSFLITAMELKQLGIRNYYFMLEVKNPFSGVCDIDPWNPNITPAEIHALMVELKQNMWFYARTVARIRTDKGVLPFELHRGLAASMWCFVNNLDSCLCEPRQTWKTTGTLAAPISWAFQIASQNTHIKLFGKETANTKKNLMDLRNSIDVLPEWLQFKRYNDPRENKLKKARQAAETLENNLFHNRVTITPKPASPEHAEGLARGESGAIMYFDEIEHMIHFPIVLANSSPAFKTASDNAKSIGNPSCRVFTTTCGNLDSRAGRDAAPVIRSMIPWTEKIYDLTRDEIVDYVSTFREQYSADETVRKDNREVVNIFYIEYQYWQLRKDHNWVLEQFALSGDKMAIRREVLNQRLRGSTESPIDPEDIEALISNMKKSYDVILLNNRWRMILYHHGITRPNRQMIGPSRMNPFDERVPYMVAVDPSGGTGNDNTAITVIHPYTLQIAAEFKSPYISGTELLRSLIDLIHNYIPLGVIIPEKNSMGYYLIHNICESSIRENLYWSKSAKELEELAVEGPDADLKKLSEQYKKYGHYTGVSSRKAMFELLFKHILECKQLLNTEYLVDDICKLVRTSTGRIEAAKGDHDDSLMSYLIGIFTYYTGDNLDFFGIDKSIHPVIGLLEPDYNVNIANQDTMSGFFSAENVTFETIQRDSIIEIEQWTKYAMSVNPRIIDPIYANNSTDTDISGVSILPSFFDHVNDL